jgi:hypothetical protein
MRRYITHDDHSSTYWTSLKFAHRHIRLMERNTGVVLNLFQEREPGAFGQGVLIESGFDITRQPWEKVS